MPTVSPSDCTSFHRQLSSPVRNRKRSSLHNGWRYFSFGKTDFFFCPFLQPGQLELDVLILPLLANSFPLKSETILVNDVCPWPQRELSAEWRMALSDCPPKWEDTARNSLSGSSWTCGWYQEDHNLEWRIRTCSQKVMCVCYVCKCL